MFEKLISEIQIRNYKCHKHQDIELNNITILTGSNAAGKSSIIQSVLLADKAVTQYLSGENKIFVNDIYGLNFGLPENLLNCNPDGDKIKLSTFFENNHDKKVSDVTLSLNNDLDLSLDISCTCNLNEKLGGIENLFYIGAERLGPRLYYPIKDTGLSVGSKGEYTAQLLNYMDSVEKLDDTKKQIKFYTNLN